jgi:hypothetical protein
MELPTHSNRVFILKWRPFSLPTTTISAISFTLGSIMSFPKDSFKEGLDVFIEDDFFCVEEDNFWLPSGTIALGCTS